MAYEYDHLIVGAGMTADAAAKAIRELDRTARVGLVGDERHAPYERPPLSKGLWKDDRPIESIDLGTSASGAVLHLGRRVVGIDRVARRVVDDQGGVYAYRRLLLATGATPRRLPIEDERVIHFRTLDDYLALRRRAVPGAAVAVVGGGFIGSEIAASLAGAGCQVTMLFPGDGIGAGRFPYGLSDFLDGYYRERGVTLRAGTRVVGGRGAREGVELALSDGTEARFDVVVAGLGVVPNTDLAAQAGLAVDDGIVVDARLRTADPDVFAAGDVARFPCAPLGMRLRVEHENAAIGMGRHAGRVMAGTDEDYTTLPFFYSDLFDLGYEAVGLLDDRLDVVEQWVQPYREGVVYYLDDGRVRGVLLWNVWGQVEAARDLVAEAGPHDADSVRGRLPRLA